LDPAAESPRSTDTRRHSLHLDVRASFSADDGKTHASGPRARRRKRAREMSREFMFENDDAVCWKTTIAPNNPLKMHRHDRSRCIVGLQGGTLKKTEEDGTVSDLTFETGKAYWLDADPPDELHADVNEGDRDIVVIVTEFKTEEERAEARTIAAKRAEALGKAPFVMPEGWEPPTEKRT